MNRHSCPSPPLPFAEGSGSHLNLFNSRQQPKKKRKSRTAFTNHQIFELEKRFLYQKYLSPADRDEIAAGLGLSNAQVITWFQVSLRRVRPPGLPLPRQLARLEHLEPA